MAADTVTSREIVQNRKSQTCEVNEGRGTQACGIERESVNDRG
jgi:hypothetical protein